MRNLDWFAASFGAERVLNAMFAGNGSDVVSYLLVAPGLLLVTFFAAYIPARRASRLDPIRALRHD